MKLYIMLLCIPLSLGSYNPFRMQIVYMYSALALSPICHVICQNEFEDILFCKQWTQNYAEFSSALSLFLIGHSWWLSQSNPWDGYLHGQLQL